MATHVISGLKAKQHDIGRRISGLENDIGACRADLVSLSEALRIFGDPEAYVKPEAMFGRGDLARTIFGALRNAPDGLGVAALTGIVAKANNFDMSDTKLAPMVRTRVNNARYRYMHKGEVLKPRRDRGRSPKRTCP